MVYHKCNRCYKEFTHTGTYMKHINRKFPCKKLHDMSIPKHTENTTKVNIPQMSKKSLSCNFCYKVFKQQFTLNRHMKNNCKVIKNNDNRLLNHIMKELKEIREENQKLKTDIKKIKTVNTINNTVNNTDNKVINSNNKTTNNINMVVFGHEDMELLKEHHLKWILNKGYLAVPELAKIMHFNDNKPGYQNVYISNMRDKYLHMYKGDKWVLEEKVQIIDEIFNTKKDFLLEKYDKMRKRLPEHTTKKFDRFVRDQQDKQVIENTKNDITMLLYNERMKPMETRRKMSNCKK